MRLIILSLASALAISACADQDASAPAESSEHATPSAAAPANPPPAAPGDAPAQQPPADACGAAERQDWIGRARSDLPSAPAGANWRIHETGQPITQDLRQDRLNIEIDPDSQTVVRLTCG